MFYNLFLLIVKSSSSLKKLDSQEFVTLIYFQSFLMKKNKENIKMEVTLYKYDVKESLTNQITQSIKK